MAAEAVRVLLLSALSLVTTLVGVALAVWVRASDRAVAAGIGFSAGMMILVSLIELLPEAASSVPPAEVVVATLLGMGLVWLAHWAVPHVHLVAETGPGDPRRIRSAYLVVLGLVLHDLPEGFAMANAYVAAPSLGVLTALAIALHNLPEEFAMAVPAAAVRRKRLLYGAAVLSALAEPAGAALGLVAVSVAPALSGFFLAFAAGAMLFVSVHELIPMARLYRHGAFFAAGSVLSMLAFALLGWITAMAFEQVSR
jgi:ZIP family zinc transporter